MLNLNSIMVGTMQLKEMAELYEKVFEKKPICKMIMVLVGKLETVFLDLAIIQKW